MEWTEKESGRSDDWLTFDYGSWMNFRYVDFNEDDNDSSALDTFDSLSWMDTRLWFKATFKPQEGREHSVYIRIKDLLEEKRPDDTAGGFDHDGPHLDYAYAVVDQNPWWVAAGRRYFRIGQGIAYSDAHDGLEFLFQSDTWAWKGFISHTLPHEDNIDLSVPGFDKESDRFFYGLEARIFLKEKHQWYGYLLVQRDYSNERPEDPEHDYTYDSEYYGIGAEGPLRRDLLYNWEIIKESGSSFIFESNEKRDIDAWALKAELAYQPPVTTHPRLSLEYAFGSGDAERTSVTDTQGGNVSGKDKNFLYFGYLNTGYALTPRLSNLYFYRGSFSFYPFEHIRPLKKLNVALDYYRYFKHRSTGGIYDTEATQDNSDVGWEVDLTAAWPVFSDLYFSLQYGHFKPGRAYPDSWDDNESYYSVSMTLIF